MSALAKSAESPGFDSVESIVTELCAIFSRQFEIREDLTAKGVPMGTVNMLVDMAKSGSTPEFESQCQGAAKVAHDKFGVRAVGLTDLKNGLVSLAELDEDAVFVKKMAKGMSLNTQAISMLTNIIRQNPGDGGGQILSLLMEYGSACGVKIEGMRLVESGSAAPESVLPDIDISEPAEKGLLKYKEWIIELALAALVTYSALALLT